MLFHSRYNVDIPVLDVLSYIFDDVPYDLDRPLFIDVDDPSNMLTARGLKATVKKVGKGLKGCLGVQLGDVVLICSPNRVFTPALVLGTLCAGAIVSGANPTFTEYELTYQIQNSGAKVIVVEESNLELTLKCCQSLRIPTESVILFTDERGPKRGFRTYGDLLHYGTMDWERLTTLEQVQQRVVALNYSSGTTGLPKGCEISAYNMVANCCQMIQGREMGDARTRERGEVVLENEIQCAYLPFYHAMGQMTSITSAKMGDTTYVMNQFNFEKLVEAIEKYHVTHLACVPPIIVLFAKHPLVRKKDLSSLRTVHCGAAPLGRDLHHQAETAIDPSGKLKIQQAWGMSEATLVVSSFQWDEYDPDVDGVGYLVSNMTAKIVDDDDNELGYGETGEILLKGPNIFQRYWKDPRSSAEAFTDDGWYRTGDVAMVKRSGILRIVDRKKELIKVKGRQVAPAELEGVLLEHPDVADAAVIGIPGEGTEYPRAYVTPSTPHVDPSSLAEYLARRLSPFKWLKGGVVLVDSIPKSPSGKILRRLLREQAVQEMSASRQLAKL